LARRFRLWLVPALLLLLPPTAHSEPRTIPLPDAARLAISLGDLKAAEDILVIALNADPSSTDALFLMGEVESREGSYDKAVPYYRRILVDHPGLVRVRLDLARALYETHDDEAAEYHFRLALADPDLPQSVIDNVYRYLAAIRQRKRYTFFFELGVAPDTNINAAPALDQVTLFGLPFTLSEPAKQKSGVGIVVNTNGEYLTPLAPDIRLRTGASLYRAEYPGSDAFDDMQLRLDAGPQFLFNRSDVSVLAVLGKRWFGNDPYNEGHGGRIEASRLLTDNLRLEGYIEGLDLSYHTQTFLDGFTVNGVLFSTYGLSSSSFVRLITGAGTERTQSPAFSNFSLRLGTAYQQDFPYGLTAYLEPDVTVTQYDATNVLFGMRRHDTTVSARLALNKRDWQVLGFSPVFSYTFTRNYSNIDFFGFTRHQLELGMTRDF
jgi:tetratricopeptide (TPR) repeat protein